MDISGSGLLPNKHRRTLTPKGKEKIGEDAVCGICFSGGGLAVRGLIDSCDHYFCFICIMEWAKVESRCPMCKQRFRVILRPEVPGLFTSDSVLEIPVRDQVYQPLENERSALSDPYAQTNCSVCHGSNDDELLLLCDLCDSACHTYCTGLGYTVPEGDWYCHDCTILREEHAKIDGDADDRDQDQGILVLDQQQPVSIFDIVAEARSSIEPFAQQNFHERLASTNSTYQQNNSEGVKLYAEESEYNYSPARGTGSHLQLIRVGKQARTLKHPCNIQSRIRALRKNWNALRSGSLAFSSALDSNGDALSCAKPRTSRTNSDLSLQSKPSTLFNSEKLAVCSSPNEKPRISDSHDIDKAWKMMQKAKAQSLSMSNTSLNLLRNNNSLKSAGAIADNKMAANNSVGCMSGTYNQISTKVMHENHKYPGCCQKFPGTESTNQLQNSNRLAVNTSSVMQFDSFKTNRVLTTEFTGNVKAALPVRHSSKFHKTTCSSLSSTSCDAGRKSYGVRCTKQLPQEGEESASEHACRSSSKQYAISDNNAKSEIQSLVKLNLQRLIKGECLGSMKFKEIARASTHSILAACGLEHSKQCFPFPFPNQVCRHNRQQQQQLHGSTLMPGSCRECFHSFVKDVVKSILLDKSTSSAST